MILYPAECTEEEGLDNTCQRISSESTDPLKMSQYQFPVTWLKDSFQRVTISQSLSGQVLNLCLSSFLDQALTLDQPGLMSQLGPISSILPGYHR